MMKAVVILCLCTVLLVNAGPQGGGGQEGGPPGGQEGGPPCGQGGGPPGGQGGGPPGGQGGPPSESIDALDRTKRQLPIPGMNAMLSTMGISDPSALMAQFQQFMNQYPAAMAKFTEFFAQLKPTKRRRRHLTKWDFESTLFKDFY